MQTSCPFIRSFVDNGGRGVEGKAGKGRGEVIGGTEERGGEREKEPGGQKQREGEAPRYRPTRGP